MSLIDYFDKTNNETFNYLPVDASSVLNFTGYPASKYYYNKHLISIAKTQNLDNNHVIYS